MVVVDPLHFKAIKQHSLRFVFLYSNQHGKRVIDLRVSHLKGPQRLLKRHCNCVHRFKLFRFDLRRCPWDPKGGVEVLNGLFDVQSSLAQTQDLFVEVESQIELAAVLLYAKQRFVALLLDVELGKEV